MIYSKQRELILKAVLENRVHPTADAVFSFLKPDHPELSLATVYRNLNQLAKNGLLIKTADGIRLNDRGLDIENLALMPFMED